MSTSPRLSLEADVGDLVARLTESSPGRRAGSPDVVAQLKQSLKRPLDHFVCVEADLDPSVNVIRRFAREHATDIEVGVRVLSKLLGIPALRVTSESHPRAARVYPRLEPSLLIRQLFARRLAFGKPPTDVGVFFIDAITCAHVGAVAEGRAPADVTIVVDDHTTLKRHRTHALAHDTVADVLSRCGIDPMTDRILSGPTITERYVSLDARATDTDLWLHLVAPNRAALSAACTRCGNCAEACPVLLQPAMLLDAAQRRDSHAHDRHGAARCVECGLCTLSCPSELPLLASIRELKTLAS